MSQSDMEQQLSEAQETIRALQEELAETNRGLVALTMELEQRVDERTAELRAAHAELEKTNSELLQLTLELEDRVAERTANLLQAKEEISNMSQQLWQATKLATMGELAASIAHELNNPLATVSLRVESLLLQVPEEDKKRKALEVIEQETERMANLVSNLLQFSRRSGQRISTVDVREEIENTLELVHYRFRNHGITVNREFAAETPMIHADRQQLRQLFLNVFTNAIDAMREQGSGTLTIRVGVWACGRVEETSQASATQTSTLTHSHTPTQIIIEITDTGIGIPPENLSRVMDPFFTTKLEGKGTGLGMAICKRIVQEHHGAFDIESEVGKGTTVRISLPVANGTNGKMLKDE